MNAKDFISTTATDLIGSPIFDWLYSPQKQVVTDLIAHEVCATCLHYVSQLDGAIQANPNQRVRKHALQSQAAMLLPGSVTFFLALSKTTYWETK